MTIMRSRDHETTAQLPVEHRERKGEKPFLIKFAYRKRPKTQRSYRL